jgi:hypothetical protein
VTKGGDNLAERHGARQDADTCKVTSPQRRDTDTRLGPDVLRGGLLRRMNVLNETIS